MHVDDVVDGIVLALDRGTLGGSNWATDAKARRELDYAPRDLATGMADTFRDGI